MPIAGSEGFQEFYSRVCVGMSRTGQMGFTHFVLEYVGGELVARSEDGSVFGSMVIVDQILWVVVGELREVGVEVAMAMGDDVASFCKAGEVGCDWELRHVGGELVLSHSSLVSLSPPVAWREERFDLADPDSISRLVDRVRGLV